MVQQRLGYVIKRAQQELRLHMDAELGKIELTTPQYATLSILEEATGLSNAELARRCFLTPQTMHKIVTGLEEKGFVKRESDPSHGRKINTLLTSSGEQLLKSAHSIVRKVELYMTANLSEKDINTTIQHLESCIKSLEERS